MALITGLTTVINDIAVSGTTLFAASNNGNVGMYKSTNNGGSWTIANNGMTAQNIQQIAISGNNIFCGSL
ncbi:MAG: hypothetical protein IPG85_01380 [Bacteroidetes bacterium]|nr:hypothetical protein [Bacteroidota bacterium]